jgi:class 3 adenylate cyclase
MDADSACATCGTEPHEARFCDGGGSAIAASPQVAEYKQVTVLFADVVGSDGYCGRRRRGPSVSAD